MTNASEEKLIQAYAKLESDLRDLDYRYATFYRDLLAACKGNVDEFMTFCKSKLCHTHAKAEAALQRTAALKVIADSATWNRLGGFAKIQRHVDLPASKLADAVGEAVTSTIALDTAVRRLFPSQVTPTIRTAPQPKLSRAQRDASELARFLVGSGVRLPRRIKEIVDVYAPQIELRA